MANERKCYKCKFSLTEDLEEPEIENGDIFLSESETALFY